MNDCARQSSSTSPEAPDVGAKRNQRFVIGIRGFSAFGDYLSFIGLTAYVYGIHDNAVMVGAFLLCRVFGGASGGILSKIVYSRWHGKWPLWSTQILRAVLLLALAVAPASFKEMLIFPIMFFIGAFASASNIGISSQLRRLIPKELILRTNVWTSSLSSIGLILGSVAGGWLIGLMGLNAALYANLLLLLAASSLSLGLRFNLPAEAASKPEERHLPLRSALACAPIIGFMLLITFGDTVGSASHNVGFPVLSKIADPTNPGWALGLFWSTWAIGNLAGAWSTRKFGLKTTVQMERTFFLGVLTMSLGFVLAFFQQQIPAILGFLLVAGIGDGLSGVSFSTRVQHAEEQVQLSVFSSIATIQNIGFGIGNAVVGPFFAWWKPGLVLLLFHGLPICLVLCALIALRKSLWVGRQPREEAATA
jgi:MFS family permease